MTKLFIFVGLPGSGKSYNLEKLERGGFVDHECIYHDYHANAYNDSEEVTESRHYKSLINQLKNGKDCAVADIAFCDEPRLRAFVDQIKEDILSVQLDITYFEYNPAVCGKNIEIRGRRSIENAKAKLEEFKSKYKIPKNAKILKVHDCSLPQNIL